MKPGTGQKLYQKAKKIIPGGTQLLSKRPEMFLPDLWPAYYSKAKGCEVWDLDGNKYIDMSYMGVGSCIIGYADPDVDKAVKTAIDLGSMTTLNCYEEVELAQLLCKIHPWAQMARFARSGGEAMAIAIRIARAKSGKDLVLFCGYHGWHDWYLSSNLADDKSLDGHLLPGLEPKGVPRALKGTAIPFYYNDKKGFLELVKKYKEKIGVIAIAPARNYSPKEGFLELVRKTADKLKIPLVFDEVSSGFRLNTGGAHLLYKIYPDIAVFSKSIGNGFPISAIIGTKDVMSAAEDTFISSTNWTDRIGPTAALATIKKYKKLNISKHLAKVGLMVQNGWINLGKKHKIELEVTGIPPLGHLTFNYPDGQILKTLFTQAMLEKGFLATNAFYASYAHKTNHVKKYLKACDQVFDFIKKVLDSGKDPKKYLKSSVSHTGFKRLT